mmetsp:Transcript_23760/g.28668  ORF Transcript_23760/g.28668 Transcript_23760/m.28668 type:complete len:94 (+) Transcript_23760:87-368(+)
MSGFHVTKGGISEKMKWDAAALSTMSQYRTSNSVHGNFFTPPATPHTYERKPLATTTVEGWHDHFPLKHADVLPTAGVVSSETTGNKVATWHH